MDYSPMSVATWIGVVVCLIVVIVVATKKK